MQDHDQRFKTLLRVFFAEFLRLFFAVWAEFFDLNDIDWIDKEVFPEPPQGSRHTLDLVARLKTREAVSDPGDKSREHWTALIHIEVESPDRAKPVRQRMHRAYVHLRDNLDMPVLPIVLFLRVGLDGIGIDVYEEKFRDFEVIRFQYLYVGLPALDAIEYVQGDNWLGVALAALMKIPPDRVAWLGAEALRKIAEAPLSEQKRYLLAECVQAYLPLEPAQQEEFERLVAGEPYTRVRQMNATWFEKGLEQGRREMMTSLEKVLEQGREQGREEAYRSMVARLLELRFGPLSAGIHERLRLKPIGELDTLFQRALTETTLRDLDLAD